MPTLNTTLATLLSAQEARHERRQLHAMAEMDGALTVNGARLLSFAGNDYLGLRSHPKLLAAAHAALDTYGSGAGAARLISGNHLLYAPLEAALAAHAGTEAALVFGSGYATSIGVIPALVGEGDLIVADKLIHACMLDGAKIAGAKLVRFAHNDMAHAESLLKTHRGAAKHCLILTEHVFSMDGDKAPISALSNLAKQYDAWLMVDDAHGLGVCDKPKDVAVDIWMGTLSKAAASYGGYVCGSALLVQALVSSARSFVFSTGLPPAAVAASHAALQVMQSEPQHRENLWQNIAQLAQALGIVKPQSAIVPLVLGESEVALKAAATLREAGFFVPAIRPPTVPPGKARLRIALSAAHKEADIAALAQVLQTIGGTWQHG